jgi:spore maturation protein CgeB
MKVLFTNDPPLIKYGVAEGFKQLGHEVRVLQGDLERLWGQTIPEQIQRFQKAIKEFRPDFIFTEGHPGFDPKTICEIAIKYGIPHLYWAIEDPICTDISIKAYIPYVDYVFTTTVERIPLYQSLGKKAELLLFGCNPEFHRFTGIDRNYCYDIVLVANNYSSRYEEVKWFLLPLVENGFNIKVWGIWWDDASRPVNLLKYPEVYGNLLPYEELPKVYSSAKIILGVNCDDTSLTQTSMRPYETLACGGGLYLGHYTKAQANLFPELIFQTSNTGETLATVNKILNLPESERKTLAQKGQAEVYRNHSYALRAEQIIKAFQSI